MPENSQVNRGSVYNFSIFLKKNYHAKEVIQAKSYGNTCVTKYLCLPLLFGFDLLGVTMA